MTGAGIPQIIGEDAVAATIAGPVRPTVDQGRRIAAVAVMADVAGATISGWPRPVIFDRKIASRTAVKTGRLIGDRTVVRIDRPIAGRIVERIAVRMLEEKCAGWIAPIKWLVIVANRGGTTHGPLRWTGPTGSSEPSARNDRSALNDRRDRKGLSVLRGPGETSRTSNVRGGRAAAPGDLPGAAVLSDLQEAGHREMVME